MIAGVLLASGASRRFGSDKLLAPLDGRPIIRWSAEALAASVDAMYVVVPEDSALLRAALDGITTRWVENGAARTGMASSIRAGIAALAEGTEAVIIALADQPLVDPCVAGGLVARWRTGGVRAVAPRYEEGRGHPVLFDASLFGALVGLTGDQGARGLLDELGDELALVPAGVRAPVDVDTPDVLRAVAEELARRTRRPDQHR